MKYSARTKWRTGHDVTGPLVQIAISLVLIELGAGGPRGLACMRSTPLAPCHGGGVGIGLSWGDVADGGGCDWGDAADRGDGLEDMGKNIWDLGVPRAHRLLGHIDGLPPIRSRLGTSNLLVRKTSQMHPETSILEVLGPGESWKNRSAKVEERLSDTEIETDSPRIPTLPTREQRAALQEYHKQRTLLMLRRGFRFHCITKKKARASVSGDGSD